MNGLALCAGVGGLELGISLAVPEYRTVCYVEREAYAASVLVARMADKALDSAPIWDDLTTFDGRPWRGVVDIITAGIPCQPYSVAGRQEGHADERALWPEFVRIVGECRPALVFIENVPRFAAWFREPGERLCELGYEIEEPLFLAAEDVGAPHKRERVFILAHAKRAARWPGDGTRRTEGANPLQPRGEEGTRGTGVGDEALADAPGIRLPGHREDAGADSGSERQSEGCGLPKPSGRGGDVADTSGLGRLQTPPPSGADRTRRGDAADPGGELAEPNGPRRTETGAGGQEHPGSQPEARGCELADAQGDGCSGGGLPVQPGRPRETSDVPQWGLPLFPPGPQDLDLWTRVLAEAPTLEPALCRVANELAYRVDSLRACGNGVVPLVAAVAFLALTARVGIAMEDAA